MISPISKLLSSSLSKNDNNNNRIVYSTSKEKKTDDGKSFIEVKKNTSFSFHTQLSIFFDFIKDKEGRKSIDNITASSSSTSSLPNNNYSNFSPSCFATVVEKNNGHQRFQRIIICDDYLSSTLNRQQEKEEKEFNTSTTTTTTTTTSIKTNSSSWSSSSSSSSSDDDNDHNNNIQGGKSSPLFSKSDDELFIEAIAQGNYQILDHLINNQELIPTKQLFIDYLKSIYNEYKYLDFKLSILQIDILPPPTSTSTLSSFSSFSTSSIFQTKKESESKPRSRLSSIELVDKEEEETEKKDIVESSPSLLTISKEEKKEKEDGRKVFSNNDHLCNDRFDYTQSMHRSSIPSGIPPFYSMGRLLINHFGDSSVIVCSLTGEILFSTLRTKYLPKKESPSLFISPTPIVGFPPSLSSSSSSTSFSTPCVRHNNACCCRCSACNQLVDNISIGDLYIEGENINSTEFISFPPLSSKEEE